MRTIGTPWPVVLTANHLRTDNLTKQPVVVIARVNRVQWLLTEKQDGRNKK